MIWFLIFLVLTQIAEIFSDCEIPVDHYRGPGLVLQPVLNDYVISRNPYAVEIPDNGVLEIFCGSKFSARQLQQHVHYRGWDERPNTKYNNNNEDLLIFSCKASSTYFRERSTTLDYLLSEYTLICKDFKVPFYATKLDYCAHSGFQYGIEVKGVPIVLAEFCYNFNTMDIVSIHYVAGKRPSLLNQQMDFNPTYMNMNELSQERTVLLPKKEYSDVIPDQKLKAFHPYAENIAIGLRFEFHELVPSSAYVSFLKDFVGDVNSTNLIQWWKPLRDGNWGIFQKIFNKYTTKRVLEIYAGKSGVALFPQNLLCNSEQEMTYKIHDEEKPIPLYIWNYIIPRSEKGVDKEFVLVAVNSPFFEDSMVICEDICDSVEWMKPLELTRKNPVFGYIFCCRPDEVVGKLDGFPQLNVNQTQQNNLVPLIKML